MRGRIAPILQPENCGLRSKEREIGSLSLVQGYSLIRSSPSVRHAAPTTTLENTKGDNLPLLR